MKMRVERGLMRRIFSVLLLIAICFFESGCKEVYLKSIGAERVEFEEKSYVAEFETVWMAVLDALKSYRLDVSNRDTGSIITRWKDNTTDLNLTDGDGTIRPYIKAQYRYVISVFKTKLSGKDLMRVRVQRDQMVQSDPMDEMRRLESDMVKERTLIYRISRLIEMKSKLEELEKIRVDRELKKAAKEQNLQQEQANELK